MKITPVKGISKGSVTIYVSAGSITKEVNLTVKVKRQMIIMIKPNRSGALNRSI